MNTRAAWTPAQIDTLPRQDLSRSICVVIDVLRATTTATTALVNGATAIYPVRELDEARMLHAARPAGTLLCGERNGLPPAGFDLGNSPREFTAERVAGKELIHTTTNGTRALKACAAAPVVLAGCFRNLAALAAVVKAEYQEGAELLLVCAGTHEDFSLEDALFAGALCERLDLAHPLRNIWRSRDLPLATALSRTRNGRNLLRLNLAEDVTFCAETDVTDRVPRLHADGALR